LKMTNELIGGIMTTKEEKSKALLLAMATIEKQHGKEAIMKLGERAGRVQVDVIPTGALPLDLALGTGGLPRGRVVEVYGPESSGKTTLCLQVVAQAPKVGRHRRLHRRRTRHGPRLRQTLGRGHRKPIDFPARFRRAGSGNHRSAGSKRRVGRDRR
jgi:hypothetical protein